MTAPPQGFEKTIVGQNGFIGTVRLGRQARVFAVQARSVGVSGTMDIEVRAAGGVVPARRVSEALAPIGDWSAYAPQFQIFRGSGVTSVTLVDLDDLRLDSVDLFCKLLVGGALEIKTSIV